MTEHNDGEFVLGVDLGTNSLGWAIIGLVDGEPESLIRAGVRVFEAGVNIDPKSGKEETLNAQRREARSQRRQTWRRARRLTKTFNVLRRFGLLPSGDASTPFKRRDFINELDQTIRNSAWFQAKASSREYPEPSQTLPYILRDAALHEALDLHFLGRALYHLAQRRGFWSNRKTAAKKDDERGKVEEGIRTLRTEMKDKTLGEYFAHVSPFDRHIRRQWTSRDMYQQEFKAIWAKQDEYRAGVFTDERKALLYRALFDQRRMKIRRNLVGACEFEQDERRAPMYLLVSQRFRLLQVVNNLKVRPSGGQERLLTKEERAKLISTLERCPAMKFKVVREHLGLSRRDSINLQRDKEEAKLPGNDTGAQFWRVFGDRWFTFSEEEQDKIVADAASILSNQDSDERQRRAQKYLRKREAGNLNEAVRTFLDITFEAGYSSLSAVAMKRFEPLLRCGFPYGAVSPHYRHFSDETIQKLIHLADNDVPKIDACNRVFTTPPDRHVPLTLLPPVQSEQTQRCIGAVRNPIVTRSLTELRKVVNSIVRTFGRPTRVHIELLRELKKPKKVRERIWKENFSAERRNDEIRQRIQRDANVAQPSPRDIEKHKLWEESGNICPYCVTGMSWPNLFGDDSEYHVDHIIPWKRCLDDSFANKVLCHADCNQRKGDRTPYEAFNGDPDRYNRIIQCVAGFNTDKDMLHEKVKRFEMGPKELEEFLARRTTQQFNDSAYASRLAADYVGLLYGGRQDEHGNLRVQARSGGLTRYFREAWNLNMILGDGEHKNGGKTPKPRHDHRHHAVDGVVIALTNQEMVQRLNNAAKRGWVVRRGRFGDFDEPWPGFRNELKKEVIEKLVVSHRVSNKVSGALHKDTNYSLKEFGKGVRRHRVALTDLSEKDVLSDDVIADAGVRKLVRERLCALGGGEPKKLFTDNKNLPHFHTADGRKIPVKKVRINETMKTRQIGEGERRRFAKPGGNHHLEIFGLPGSDGKDKQWDTLGVVTMLEAYARLSAKPPQPIVQKQFDPDWEFRFSLAQHETLEFDKGPFQGRRFVVRTISEEEKTGSVKIEMVPINDARQKDQIKKSKMWVTKSPNELRKWGTRKVIVKTLGDVSEAHD